MNQLKAPKYVFCGNHGDPRSPDHDRYIMRSFHESPEMSVFHEYSWLDGKLLGKPQANDTYTQAQLEEMGLVSIWRVAQEGDEKYNPIEISDFAGYKLYQAPAHKLVDPMKRGV